MAKIIRLMKALDYPTYERGVCGGIAEMAERARNCGQYDVFQKRMRYLASLNETQTHSLKTAIQKAQTHANKLEKHPRTRPLTEEETILLSIEPFFFQIWAHFYPKAIQTFLNLDGPTIAYHQTSKLEELMYTKGAESDIAPLPVSTSYLINEENEYGGFLKQFLETVQKAPLASGMLISSPSHTIHLFFDHGAWHLTNHDYLKNYSSLDEVLAELNKILKSHQLQIRLFTGTIPQENKDKQSLLAKCKDIADRSITKLAPSKPYWFTKPIYSLAGYMPFFRHASNSDESSRLLQDKKNCLNMAAKIGQEKVMETLLADDTIDINEQDAWGARPLTLAAVHGNEGIVRLLVNHPKIGINYTNLEGDTPLILAAENGYVGIVELLLRHPDIDVNQKNAKGDNPLTLAITHGHLEVTKLLLDNPNIDLKQKNAKGDTPLTLSVTNGRVSILEELFHHMGITPHEENKLLLLATNSGQIKIVDWLFDHCPNMKINEASKNGLTPLWFAVAGNHKNIVQRLLEVQNIDINKSDEKGMTPLFVAAVKGNKEILKLLLKSDPHFTSETDDRLNDLCDKLCQAVNKSIIRDGIIAMNNVLASQTPPEPASEFKHS